MVEHLYSKGHGFETIPWPRGKYLSSSYSDFDAYLEKERRKYYNQNPEKVQYFIALVCFIFTITSKEMQ